jgi:hypothetical protein
MHFTIVIQLIIENICTCVQGILDRIICLLCVYRPCIIRMEVEYTEDLIIYEKAEHAVIEGDDLIIKCEFQSKFQVKSTTWLFNGTDLEINSKDDKYTSSLDENSSSLTNSQCILLPS